jgi:kynureninase
VDYQNSLQFAQKLDREDPLKGFRDLFYIPKHGDGEVIYFTGNSLGLQPKSAQEYIQKELDNWAEKGVEGHFEGERPWLYYHKQFKEYLAELVGANASEVVSMNNLTANIHILLATFYRPIGDRYKILMESGAFPSDQYAIETQVRLKGYDPEDAIIEVSPANGSCLTTEEILAAISENGESLCLVFFSGVQYYTGQRFDLAKIASAAHDTGAFAGFDLAHAAGNVELNLHAENVDFAMWCSYKYLNSGPGNVSGVFIHDKHGNNTTLPRFGGWWGHDEESRFLMEKGFSPMKGADGWQLSNVNILASAAHLASLKIFNEAGMDNLLRKSKLLTGFLEFIVNEVGEKVSIITPSDPSSRGCQLSLIIRDGSGKKVFDRLTSAGVVVDWREPDVIRAAPVPLYNTFEDVFVFGHHLRYALENG